MKNQKQKYRCELISFGTNMDAIAEAGKIGMKADHAQNYSADPFGTRRAYADMPTMSTTFRTEDLVSFMSTENMESGDGERAFERAVKGLKSAVRGLKKSSGHLKEYVEGLFQAAEANGGEIPDVNEILKQVLDKKQGQHIEGHNKKDVSESDKELFRRHRNSEAVFIDAWCPGADENKVPEEELLPGEIEAVTFQVGCYTVRSALRVYKVHDSDWYLLEVGEPADKEDTEMVKNDLMLGKGNGNVDGVKGSILASWGNIHTYADSIPPWRDKLRITHEISAKHNSNGGKAFTYICRATDPMNDRWFEYIGDIYAVKERDTIPDESASLLIYFVYTSDINGAGKWYRFEPGEAITTFVSDLPDLGRS